MTLVLVALLVVPLGAIRLIFWVVDSIRQEARSLERERCAAQLDVEATRRALKGDAQGAEGLRGGARVLRQGVEASS